MTIAVSSSTPIASAPGTVDGAPALILRAEGAALLAACVTAYGATGGGLPPEKWSSLMYGF